MKTIHVHITLWVILLVGGFLLGFVPEYLKNRELAGQLESPLKTIDALKLQLELGGLRDDAGLMLLELSRQNYGLARDHANTYYSKLNDLISESRDESLKKSLTEFVIHTGFADDEFGYRHVELIDRSAADRIADVRSNKERRW